MRHCDVDFEDLDVWFLKDIKGFTHRTLTIGRCPNCKKNIVVLCETRIEDERVFNNEQVGRIAEKIAIRERKRIVYTQSQHHCYSGGWVYGVNTEIKHKVGAKKGQISTVRQYSYDYATDKNKGKVKQIKV